MSKAYQAKQQASAALIGGLSDAVSGGVGAYTAGGGTFTNPFASTPTAMTNTGATAFKVPGPKPMGADFF